MNLMPGKIYRWKHTKIEFVVLESPIQNHEGKTTHPFYYIQGINRPDWRTCFAKGVLIISEDRISKDIDQLEVIPYVNQKDINERFPRRETPKLGRLYTD